MPWFRKGGRGMRRRADDDDSSTPQLDDAFVRLAPVIELSAAQRAAKQRRHELHRDLKAGERRAAASARRARRARRWRRLPGTAVLVAVVAGVGWMATQGSRDGGNILDRGPTFFRYESRSTDAPPPGRESASAPLGRPAPVASPSEQFRFMFTQPGSDRPVAYDPCRPIHVVVNQRTAPPGADILLDRALESVRMATGLAFVRDGNTDEAPSPDRRPYQPDRHPKRWAPVLIAWSDPGEVVDLDGAVAGTGGSLWVSSGDERVYVTGVVTLDGPQLAKRMGSRDGRDAVQAVILHELGHLVGLDHVVAETEVMSSKRGAGTSSYGAGDLTGLARLGQGRCHPAV